MLIYIFTLALVVIYSIYPYTQNNSRKSKKIFLWLSFSTMALVLGLRGSEVGEDTKHYLNVFAYSKNVKWSDMFRNINMRTGYYTDQYGYTDTIEDGFLTLAKAVHLFTNNGQVFLFLIALLTCGLFAKFIYENSEDVFFSTYVFLCESMFMIAFNAARQILATAIAVQAYALLKDRKWIKAALIVLLAALIHNTALICFTLFPIMMVKEERRYKDFEYIAAVLVLAPLSIVLLNPVLVKFFPRYASYFSTNYWTNSVGGIVTLWLAELLLVFASHKYKFEANDTFQLSCCTLVYIVCELIGLKLVAFTRIGWYFRAYIILFIPGCRSCFTKRIWQPIRFCIAIMLLFLYISYARTDARIYRFFWQCG